MRYKELCKADDSLRDEYLKNIEEGIKISTAKSNLKMEKLKRDDPIEYEKNGSDLQRNSKSSPNSTRIQANVIYFSRRRI